MHPNIVKVVNKNTISVFFVIWTCNMSQMEMSLDGGVPDNDFKILLT